MPGNSVIFDPDNVLTASQLAGLGSNGPLGAAPAVEALTFSAAVGQTLTFSASGLVGCCSVADIGPDGYASWSNINSLGSISGFVAPAQLPLVGVFTNGSPSGPAPASFNYSRGVGQPSFSPLLNQVFFIGDGLTGTGSGSPQIFNVPSGATELWLGFADALGFFGTPRWYGDNPGSLSVFWHAQHLDSQAFSGQPHLRALLSTIGRHRESSTPDHADECRHYGTIDFKDHWQP